MKGIKTVLVLGTVGVLLAGAAIAKSGGPRGGGDHGGFPHHGPFGCISSDLNLTTDQTSELEQLGQEMHTNAEVIREDNADNHPLKAALADGDFDQAAFIESMETMQSAMNSLHAEYTGLMYDVLTDEQKAIFIEAVNEDNATLFGCRGGKGPRR